MTTPLALLTIYNMYKPCPLTNHRCLNQIALLIFSFCFISGATAHTVEAVELSINDCHKCHAQIVQDNKVRGYSHSTKVTCIQCHQGNPPQVRNIIPLCSRCHRDEPHFKLSKCFRCHTNPHTPLNITLSRDITRPCTTCHDSQIEQLTNTPSIHTTLDCTACHTQHGYIPKCFRCHKAHLETMTHKDCLSCHQAHKPLEVTYNPDTPSEYCGSCHTKVYSLLGTSKAKHRAVACVRCHEAVHKTIPDCRKCHKTPHPETMLEKFSSCGQCHGIAHDLKLNRIDTYLEQQ